ncbi:acyl-CoA N-acyltransferase [Usnea florida]
MHPPTPSPLTPTSPTPAPAPPTLSPPAPNPPTPTPLTILTPRLILRAAQASDLDALHDMYSDEEVMRYWSRPPYTDKLQTLLSLADMISSPANGVLDFVIALRPAAPPSQPTTPTTPPPPPTPIIGKAGIWSPSTSELGFMLHRTHWRQGYMSETLNALLGPRGLFWEKGLERVIADVDPRNAGSIGVLRKCGFRETGRAVGTFETHLGWCDSVYLELRREGWG